MSIASIFDSNESYKFVSNVISFNSAIFVVILLIFKHKFNKEEVNSCFLLRESIFQLERRAERRVKVPALGGHGRVRDPQGREEERDLEGERVFVSYPRAPGGNYQEFL